MRCRRQTQWAILNFLVTPHSSLGERKATDFLQGPATRWALDGLLIATDRDAIQLPLCRNVHEKSRPNTIAVGFPWAKGSYATNVHRNTKFLKLARVDFTHIGATAEVTHSGLPYNVSHSRSQAIFIQCRKNLIA